MQVWPALRNALPMIPAAALSKSASSKTIKGALPPSSRETRFTLTAAAAASFFPTAVLPVNPIFLTPWLEVNSSPMALASPTTMVKTSFGTPARMARFAKTMAVSGVDSAGFRTTGHPAAKAGATLRVIMLMGKFQGVMAPTTPTGCFNTNRRRSRLGGSRTSPYIRFASSANHSTLLIPAPISLAASTRGFPHSSVIRMEMSSLCSTIKLCHFFKMILRSFAVLSRHAGKAATAVSIADRVSDVA
mmetsp:Transcript_31412/g.57033  ORF Transcript_31412/g.57033 Transcript_31412/m.57033 type:complete len:246 (+) Transcript_31412:980-1717(+)